MARTTMARGTTALELALAWGFVGIPLCGASPGPWSTR